MKNILRIHLQLLSLNFFEITMATKHRQSPQLDKGDRQKTTSGDEEKRYRLIQKLISHNPELFRQINIDEYDLNITENFEQLEDIDDVVTPLIYCAHHGLKEITRHLLRNKKIDPDLQSANNKHTPLIVACMRGNYEIARLLILAGAEVNKPNSMSHTPLAATIYRLVEEPPSFQNNRMCFRLAEFLIDHGADVNWMIDKSRGYTLLHYFCSLKIKMNKPQKDLNKTIIKFLIEKGANVGQKTLKDETVLSLLGKHCNKQQLQPLIRSAEQQQNPNNKIPKRNIKKIDQNYFKVSPRTSK